MSKNPNPNETLIPFNDEWREKINRKLHDDAAARLAAVRKEKSAAERRLAEVAGRLASLAETQRLLTDERDKLESEVRVLEAQETSIAKSLGGD